MNERAASLSLFKLVSGVPDEHRLRHPADALVIIGRQIELLIQHAHLAVDLDIGILRFSLLRLHQGGIAQIAPFCRRITVYGEADMDPTPIAGVEFVPLPSGTPLCREWFLVCESAEFWGALLTRVVPDKSDARVRRYLFEGALTADERTVNRAGLLLSLMQQRQTAEIRTRDHFTNQAYWARIAYAIATHNEATRMQLATALSELTDMNTLLHSRVGEPPATILEPVLSESLDVLQSHGATGTILYRAHQDQLQPVIWSTVGHPSTISIQSSLVGQSITQREPIFTPLSEYDSDYTLFSEAQSLTAIPLSAQGNPWGVLVVGHPEPDAHSAPSSISAAGIAALLEQILAVTRLEPPAALPASIAEPVSSPMSQYASPPIPPTPPALAPPSAPLGNYTPPALIPSLPPSVPSPPTSFSPPTGGLSAPPAPTGAGASMQGFGLPSWMRGGAPTPPPADVPMMPGGGLLSQSLDSETSENDADGEYGWETLQRRLMSALIAFDSYSSEQVWEDAIQRYTMEEICVELLMPVQIAVGEGWHRGEVSVAAEHFTTRFTEGKLLNLLNSGLDNPSAPLAVVGCVQAEMHEVGAIMLALFLRWSGFRVIYLGQNIPNTSIAETIRQLRPQVLGLSAATIEAAHNMTEVGHIISNLEPPVPQFIFGGKIFYERPDLRARIRGQFLEGDIRQVARKLAAQHSKG